MSGITEDTPLGLAAAARETGTKVTQLRQAIADGKLEAVADVLDPEARLVTPRAIRAMIASEEFVQGALASENHEDIVEEGPVPPNPEWLPPGEDAVEEAPAPAPAKAAPKKKLSVKK